MSNCFAEICRAPTRKEKAGWGRTSRAETTRTKTPRVKLGSEADHGRAQAARDRYLEQVNGQVDERLLIVPRGKYDVARILSVVEGSAALEVGPARGGNHRQLGPGID